MRIITEGRKQFVITTIRNLAEYTDSLGAMQSGNQAIAILDSLPEVREVVVNEFICCPFEWKILDERHCEILTRDSGGIFNKRCLRGTNDCPLPILIRLEQK